MNRFLDSWQEKGDWIIVFAGVFDPVHKAHINAAQLARIRQNRVLFIPEREPQHKTLVTPYAHRLQMLQIAVQQEEGMEVIDYPANQHYIKPMFSWLKEEYPDTSFSWLVGSDVLPLIHSWADIELLSEYGVKEIVSVSRDNGGERVFPKKSIASVPIRMVSAVISKRYRHMSSSWVREDLAHRHTALPDGVFEYIKENNLY